MNAPTPPALWEAGYPVATPAFLATLVPQFECMPLEAALARRCMLFDGGPSASAVGVATDPADVDSQRWVEARAGGVVRWYLAAPGDFEAWLARQTLSHAVAPGDDALAHEAGAADDKSLSIDPQLGVAASPVVRLVNSALAEGLRLGASDIHLETTAHGLVVRYRIDGVLETFRSTAGLEPAGQAISRLKVLAELDIAETRIPQDGRMSVRLGNEGKVDLRVSIMPSLHGEDAVLRILDKRRLASAESGLTLAELGFVGEDREQLRDLAAQPYGMLLASGPTGSGKTTSLYALLAEIDKRREKIVTIEDPIEYQLPGILQIPVNEKKGLTFARGLRSILRHDPDTIMVGEIRDRETAEIAVQSALTGHRVLSSVHANHVLDVFGRFAHMGIDAYLLASAINGLFAQRLLRRLCPHCKREQRPDARQKHILKLSDSESGVAYGAPAGCDSCRRTGYQGRSAIVEILALDDGLRSLIGQRAPLSEIRAAARAQGMRTLREAALALARAGITGLDEVCRVTVRA